MIDEPAGGVLQDGRFVKLVSKSGHVLLADPAPTGRESYHINDPRFGGGGCFGVHVARRSLAFARGDLPNSTWDVTERMPAANNGGFGLLRSESSGFTTQTWLSDGESYPDPILSVTRKFTPKNGSAIISVSVEVLWKGAGSPLFFKEPKLVWHSLRGFTFLYVLDDQGRILGVRDLTKLPAPSKHTYQLRYPERAAVQFEKRSWGKYPRLTVKFARSGWDEWADEADASEPLVGDCAPYCLQGPPAGKLSRAWESAHWPGKDAAGVMFHAWEGGSGYMDCLCAFRPAVPGSRYEVGLEVVVEE